MRFPLCEKRGINFPHKLDIYGYICYTINNILYREVMMKGNNKLTKYQLISMIVLTISVGMTILTMYEKFFW